MDHHCDEAVSCSVRTSEADGLKYGNRQERTIVKLVVIGSPGLIGSRLAKKLSEHGHQAIATEHNAASTALPGKDKGSRSRKN